LRCNTQPAGESIARAATARRAYERALGRVFCPRNTDASFVKDVMVDRTAQSTEPERHQKVHSPTPYRDIFTSGEREQRQYINWITLRRTREHVPNIKINTSGRPTDDTTPMITPRAPSLQRVFALRSRDSTSTRTVSALHIPAHRQQRAPQQAYLYKGPGTLVAYLNGRQEPQGFSDRHEIAMAVDFLLLPLFVHSHDLFSVLL
jgi:hypothetical protein